MNHFTIIGAGIVGLATALKLNENLSKRDAFGTEAKITILEKENGVSKHQTGNNSGVIHSGIYYKPGSLKALNCINGYKMLIKFCDENNIKYNLCGKVVVATDECEIEYLKTLYERGVENGLENLKMLSEQELKQIEPNVKGIAGIYVPQTGIIDYKIVSEKMKEILISKGVEIKFNEEVIGIEQHNSHQLIRTKSNKYETDFIISCAGLQSDRVASLTENNLNVRIIPFRGEYYKLKDSAKHLVKTLIYPVPDPNFPFLGVHFTNLIDGGVEAGPNAVFSFKREGYTRTSFNFNDTFQSLTWPGFLLVAKKYWRTGMGEFYRSFRKKAFVQALQKLIPQITESDLAKGGAGVRAQACEKNGGLVDDFYLIEREKVIHVLNAPSPAATASLAIGDYIANRVIKK
ncbi:MAG: L-2-hydroxyglutarate oxidase [Bacteroidetes bacterium]|nr:L-2-hydroxyglutarate oxidase [Bacteroidota bacterium]MBU1115954.1 L-2-hydroxyglutarate oxidase [Bacteroidota bacterium]MBU1798449.1 L-2-hydroxyglutarate oxidase [Bacteroidota bacterium]